MQGENCLPREISNGKKDLQSQIEEEDVNWSFKLTNEDIRRITGTNQIADDCEEQHLKYIGHIIRQSYESYPKKWLFANAEKEFVRDMWLQLEKKTGIDKV